MSFFSSLSFGYKVMLIGIIIFFIGVIVMIIENKARKRTSEDIKRDYMIRNDVRSSENPSIKNNTYNNYPNMSEHNNFNNSNNSMNDFMNMYK